jgi:DNA-binding GntR family transcriptional regulator
MPAERDEPLSGADPKYVRLAALLRRDITGGTLRPGTPAPSITALSRQYGHARQTCSKALRILQAEGLVVRYPGMGYFVTQTKDGMAGKSLP